MEKKDNFDLSQAIGGIYDKLVGWLDSIILNLPNFILAVIVFIVFIFIAKYVSKILNRLLLKRKIQHSVRDISIRILKLIIISFGFFIALGLLNLDKLLTSILAGAGVVGLAIGLALQGTLSNTVSGVILSFLPEIQIGDWVETNGFAGEVLEVNLRNIVIIQSDNNHVVIPNTKIVEDAFKNFSRTKRSRVMLTCGVGYESDLEKVQEITVEAISKIFKQKGNEQIEFAYESFGDSSINYVIRFWTDVSRQRDVLFAKHKAILAIKKAYNEHEINIPFPIRTLDFGKNKFRSETIHISNQQE
ncbi:mechanosensitive ion channel family protein [Mesonia sp.]|uniref:mechanosensitive ion channel family protein n=1 Tax=Mesonia sp. TaxID=1960830 RepID=UPI0017750720|nr:mechanosensitive ion channel family protein [Mesonia sp.]HIB36849.1 mechanosensitive ion channel family protein [Mesonia sp.]HIO25971.1 mechanosensitive ion channel family protein [Flavobacteriaceae bacterium]